MGLRTLLRLKSKTRQAAPDWIGEYEFTRRWALNHFPVWSRILAPYRDTIRDVLEVGSFEGMSAVYFLRAFPESRLTCIDSFSGNGRSNLPPTGGYVSDFTGIEERFDRNLSRHRARVTKLKSRSVPALDSLVQEGRKFDLIYLDCSHFRADVFTDSVLCWRLLRVGGILIWDDWKWWPEAPSAERPQHAIDVFRSAFGPCLKTLHRDYQYIVQKTDEWPIS